MAATPTEQADEPLPPVAIESTNEWQIYDILMNGQERYLQPLTFSDHVARLTHMIDWQSLVGSKLSMSEMNSPEEEVQEAPDTPNVHVWDNVAKELHAALTEINVVLDVIKVTLHKRYMLFDTVSREPSEESKPANKASEAYALVAKRKSLSLTSNILLDFVEKQRQMSNSQLIPGYVGMQNDECSFLRELTELRKCWRLKKARNIILGDLGFRSYGPKFRTCSTFEIHRRQGQQFEQQQASTSTAVTLPSLGSSQSSTVEVMLPADLKKQLILKCFIIPDVADDKLICTLLESVDPSLYQSTNKRSTSWQETLEKAQKTLLCRELFSILSKESLNVADKGCIVRGDSIYVQLNGDYILLVTLVDALKCNQPSTDAQRTVATSVEDLFVLEQNLMQIYLNEVDAITNFSIARPISAPTYNASSRIRLAGPNALSREQLGTEGLSDKLLLEQIAMQANHYILLNNVKTALEQFAEEQRDPVVSIHWCPETNRTTTLARVQMITPFYEYCSRSNLIVEVFANTIRVTMRDLEVVEFANNVEELIIYLRFKCRQNVISTAGIMARPWCWQTLSCYMNTVDVHNMPAPVTALISPCGTKVLYITYPLHCAQPKVYIHYVQQGGDNLDNNTFDASKLMDSTGDCSQVDLNLLCGTSFLQKLETLLVIL
uniref:Mediator of RNA polymerase II transcription subunit 17 n=1 Tax=Trichuris muris TaxID=70415 RepID=A0A5S6R204_TRIMR